MGRGCLLPGCPVSTVQQGPSRPQMLPHLHLPDSAQTVGDPPGNLGKRSWEMGSIALIAREMQLSALVTSSDTPRAPSSPLESSPSTVLHASKSLSVFLDSSFSLHPAYHFPGSLVSSWRRQCTPLPCSCLENSRDGELGGLPSMGSHRLKQLSSSS